MYLDEDVCIKHKNILPLLNNYKDTVNYFFEVIKNALIIMTIAYVKNYSPNFYYRVSKYAYNYKTGDLLVSYNTKSAKKMLLDIVHNKKYDQLLKPNAYQAIFHLYQVNEEKTDFFKKLMLNFNYNIAKMFMIWTISSFLNCVLVSPIISAFLIIYRDKKNMHILNRSNIYKFLIVILSAILGYTTDAYFLTSFICQFGYELVFNDIVKSTLLYLIKKSSKMIKNMYYINTAYNSQIISSCSYVAIFKTLMNMNNGMVTAVETINMFQIMIGGFDINNCIIYITLILSGYISDFHIIHVLFVNTIMYILFANVNIDIINDVIYKMKSIYHAHYKDYVILLESGIGKINKYNSGSYNKILQIDDKNNEENIEKDDINKVMIEDDSKNDMYIQSTDKQDSPDINILELSNEVGIESQVFDLPKDEFIDAISAETNNKTLYQPNASTYVNGVTNTSSIKSINKRLTKSANLDIVDNYF
jgi:hypothetical protein